MKAEGQDSPRRQRPVQRKRCGDGTSHGRQVQPVLPDSPTEPGTPLIPLQAGDAASWGTAAAADYAAGERLPLVRQPVLVLRPKDEFWDMTPRADALLPEARRVDLPEQDAGLLDIGVHEVVRYTREFFELVYQHQSEDGVLGINVAHLENDDALVRMIGATVASIYPSVYVIETQSGLNSVVVASRQPTQWSEVMARLSSVADGAVGQVVKRAEGRIKAYVARGDSILTDDHAPVEQVVHAMIVRYMTNPVSSEVNP